jgi:hypothetical protein
MVLADTDKPTTNGRGTILELVQPRSISDSPEGPKPSDPPAPAEAKPKRPGRPPGSKNRPKPAAAKAKAKADTKPSKKRPTKKAPAKAKESKVAARAAAKATEAKAASDGGNVDAGVHLEKIQKAFGRYNRAMTARTQVGKTCGEQLKAAEAAFTNAIEAPLDTTKVETDAYRSKLENVEMRWQELSETKAGNIEERKHASEKVKEARENLARVIENSAQLDLFEGE